MFVRAADVTDLDLVLAVADSRRREYATYQPQFWNPAPDALDKQRSYFTSLVDDHEALFAVSLEDGVITGFIIARLVPTPPVYDPGGATCLVDDFTVNEADSWPVAGPLLLARVRSWAADRGAAQLVVVTAGSDEPKRTTLMTLDLSLGSEWWVGGL